MDNIKTIQWWTSHSSNDNSFIRGTYNEELINKIKQYHVNNNKTIRITTFPYRKGY